MKFLFLEPFFGGSHRDFVEGLIAHSRHDIDLIKLPARFWKWRMRGAALYFVKKTPPLTAYDGLIMTDLMSVSDFKALCGVDCPPVLLYFHENQLTYPLAEDETMDFQFGFTNITSALAANRILFNSQTQFDAFFANLPGFLKMMPDYAPTWVMEAVRLKSAVGYPGCRFPADPALPGKYTPEQLQNPLIIWNHRWEFDKNPGDFFQALRVIRQKGLNFRIALLGEKFRRVPREFSDARGDFGDRIVQYGYVKSKAQYRRWLMQGSIVISTSRQENFGISIVEAMRCGCFPLLPHRLVYPEIIPEAFHQDCLYRDQADLIDKLAGCIRHLARFETKRRRLSAAMGRFSWEHRIESFDAELMNLAHG